MLVKRSAFEIVDGFREDFGKIGNKSLPEDTDLCLRIAAAEENSVWMWDPAKVMKHRVPAGRATFGYLLSRCFLQGWGKAAMARMVASEPSVALDYAVVVRADDLERAHTCAPDHPLRLLLAATVGPVRLIDNLDPRPGR